MERAGELAWRVVELYLGGAALPSEEKARLRLCMEIVIGILDPSAVRPEPTVPPDVSLPKPEEKPPAPPKQEGGEPHPFAVRLPDWMRANQKNCSRVAADLGVNPNTLRDILCGRRQPREKTLEAIRAFLSARGIE